MAILDGVISVTVNVGGKPLPINGWVNGELITLSGSFGGSRVLRERKKNKPDYSKAIKIKNLSFQKFLARRVEKDGIAFVPNPATYEARTNCESWIEAPIATTPAKFLAYAHELGHCKSKQYERDSGVFGFRSCKGIVENETNAWLWALRYFRRLGFTLDKDCLEVLKTGYASYLTSATDKEHAKTCADKITQVCGVTFPHIFKTFGTSKRQNKPQKIVKPWVQLQETKRKQRWRNIR